MKINIVIIIIIAFAKTWGQSAGATIGGGIISSNSPNVSAYTSSIFIETPVIYSSISLRLSFLYAADYNQILPNSTNVYNPFLKGVSLKRLTTQDFSELYYLDEGIGLQILNDSIFNNTDYIDYGMVISIGAGFDLRHGNQRGLRIGGERISDSLLQTLMQSIFLFI